MLANYVMSIHNNFLEYRFYFLSNSHDNSYIMVDWPMNTNDDNIEEETPKSTTESLTYCRVFFS